MNLQELLNTIQLVYDRKELLDCKNQDSNKIYNDVVDAMNSSNWQKQLSLTTQIIKCNYDKILDDKNNWITPVNFPPKKNDDLTYLKEYIQTWLSTYYSSYMDYFNKTFPENWKNNKYKKGIVISSGGKGYMPSTIATIKHLRKIGCTLPIEVYYGGQEEYCDYFDKQLKQLDNVSIFDLGKIANVPYHPPAAALRPPMGYRGYPSKALMLLLTKFENIMVLDADCTPIKDPSFLFDSNEYKTHGNIFWKDMWDRSYFEKFFPGQHHTLGVDNEIYKSLGATRSPLTYDNESGIFLINKNKTKAINVIWMLNNANVAASLSARTPRGAGVGPLAYKYMWGDKDTFELAFAIVGEKYYQNVHNVNILTNASIANKENRQRGGVISFYQPDLEGEPLFIHRVGGNSKNDFNKYLQPKDYYTMIDKCTFVTCESGIVCDKLGCSPNRLLEWDVGLYGDATAIDASIRILKDIEYDTLINIAKDTQIILLESDKDLQCK